MVIDETFKENHAKQLFQFFSNKNNILEDEIISSFDTLFKLFSLNLVSFHDENAVALIAQQFKNIQNIKGRIIDDLIKHFYCTGGDQVSLLQIAFSLVLEALESKEISYYHVKSFIFDLNCIIKLLYQKNSSLVCYWLKLVHLLNDKKLLSDEFFDNEHSDMIDYIFNTTISDYTFNALCSCIITINNPISSLSKIKEDLSHVFSKKFDSESYHRRLVHLFEFILLNQEIVLLNDCYSFDIEIFVSLYVNYCQSIYESIFYTVMNSSFIVKKCPNISIFLVHCTQKLKAFGKFNKIFLVLNALVKPIISCNNSSKIFSSLEKILLYKDSLPIKELEENQTDNECPYYVTFTYISLIEKILSVYPISVNEFFDFCHNFYTSVVVYIKNNKYMLEQFPVSTFTNISVIVLQHSTDSLLSYYVPQILEYLKLLNSNGENNITRVKKLIISLIYPLSSFQNDQTNLLHEYEQILISILESQSPSTASCLIHELIDLDEKHLGILRNYYDKLYTRLNPTIIKHLKNDNLYIIDSLLMTNHASFLLENPTYFQMILDVLIKIVKSSSLNFTYKVKHFFITLVKPYVFKVVTDSYLSLLKSLITLMLKSDNFVTNWMIIYDFTKWFIVQDQFEKFNDDFDLSAQIIENFNHCQDTFIKSEILELIGLGMKQNLQSFTTISINMSSIGEISLSYNDENRYLHSDELYELSSILKNQAKKIDTLNNLTDLINGAKYHIDYDCV